MSKKGDRLRDKAEELRANADNRPRNATGFRLNLPRWPKNWPISGTPLR